MALGTFRSWDRKQNHQEIQIIRKYLSEIQSHRTAGKRFHHVLYEQSFSEFQQGITDLDLSRHIHSFLLKVPRVPVLCHYYG